VFQLILISHATELVEIVLFAEAGSRDHSDPGETACRAA